MGVDPRSNEGELDRAYQAGQRQAEMGAQLAAHEKRLNTINGSIERGATNSYELAGQVQRLRDEASALATQMQRMREESATRDEVLAKRLDAFMAEQSTAKAVAVAQTQSIKEAAAKQISTRGFAVGVSAVFVALMGVIVAVLSAVHP